jgi:hypothetical protein
MQISLEELRKGCAGVPTTTGSGATVGASCPRRLLRLKLKMSGWRARSLACWLIRPTSVTSACRRRASRCTTRPPQKAIAVAIMRRTIADNITR